VWRTDIVIGTWLVEGDGLRAPWRHVTRIPGAIFHRRGRVIQVANVSPGHGGSDFDADARRSVPILPVVVGNLHLIHPFSDRAGGPGHSRRRWRWPQRVHLPLQGEGPHRITVRTPDPLVAAGGDGDVLLAVHLVG